MRGFRIGRILGVEIILDASWFVISLLIAWSFSNLFRELDSALNLTEGAYFAMGIAAALLFFSSVLAHELSHAVVARRNGLPVRSITLFIFGGVAQIRREPDRPGIEFKVAIVGPLISLVIGGLFLLASLASGTIGLLPAQAIFEVVGFLNLVLAGFNLIPGFPLDGGRVLRAAVWKATGNILRATRIASIGGQLMAAGLVGFGIFRIVFWSQLFGGIWSILIGIFLNQAATAGYQQLLVRQTLRGLKVADLMTPEPTSIPGNLHIDDAVNEFFLTRGHSAYPVLGYGDQVEGIVSLRTIRETPRETWDQTTVRQVMIPKDRDVVATVDEPLVQLLDRVPKNPIGRFLVLDGERLAGILSLSDISRHLRIHASLGGPE